VKREHLLYLGIILIPFNDIIISLLTSASFSTAVDLRERKEILSLSIMLIFIGWSILKNVFLPLREKTILLFIGLCFLSIFNAPKIFIPSAIGDIVGHWMYKPVLYFIIYYLFLSAITSIWNEERTAIVSDTCLKLMMWCGVITSAYLFLQFFGLDQFFKANVNNKDLNHVPAAVVGGSLGQPTIAAAYLAMMIPLALYFRKYIPALFIAIAVLLTHSHVAIAATAAGGLFLFYASTKSKLFLMILAGIFVIISIAFYVNFNKWMPKLMRDGSGRLEVWGQIIKDVNQPIMADSNKTYSFTGKGPGSYQYLFSPRYGTRFIQAHNEILECLHDYGAIGVILFISIVISILRFIKSNSRIIIFSLTSLFIGFVCSNGLFVYHLAIFNFYSIILLGILYLHSEENPPWAIG
jgi:hypothetical protein